MLITPADRFFSWCIKTRVDWVCERCGKKYPFASRGFDCCHYQGRAAWATRFEPENCFALCHGCHMYLDSRKGTFERFFKEKRGVEIYDLVLEKSDNAVLAKELRRTKGRGEIAHHFELEYNRMLELRKEGQAGRIEFVGYA